MNNKVESKIMFEAEKLEALDVFLGEANSAPLRTEGIAHYKEGGR